MKSTILLASLCTTLAGCASVVYTISNPSLALAQTPGEYFRQYLAKADAECREKQLGPYLPSDEPQGSPRRANATCRFMFLKPWQPGDSPESAYAHSLKLPPPHDKPVDVYKPGMSPREYFEALCATQAGEFIFRRVEGVQGIAELRPRPPLSSELNRHLTAYEDPSNADEWFLLSDRFLNRPARYQFVEKIATSNAAVDRFSGYDGNNNSTQRVEKRNELTARYAFTWRGIASAMQLDNGIAGGELLVIDRQTNEVMAVKRGFRFRWLGRFPSEQGISQTGFGKGASCKQENKKSGYETLDFLLAVAKPTIK